MGIKRIRQKCEETRFDIDTEVGVDGMIRQLFKVGCAMQEAHDFLVILRPFVLSERVILPKTLRWDGYTFEGLKK